MNCFRVVGYELAAAADFVVFDESAIIIKGE
jgi:hypothetical protein